MTGRYPGIVRKALPPPEGPEYSPREIRVVTPIDWWEALPANVQDGYASKVVAAVELLYPRARVTHVVRGARRVWADIPCCGGSRRDEAYDRDRAEEQLGEIVRDVWERETG